MVAFLVCWNVLDLIFSAFVTHRGYTFGYVGDLGLPVVVSIVLGYLFFLRKPSK